MSFFSLPSPSRSLPRFFSVLCHFMGKPHWHCCRDCLEWWVAVNGQRWMKLMTVCEPCWNFLWRGPSLTPSESHVLMWVTNALLNHSSVSALKHTYTFEDEKEPFSSKDEIMFICKYNKPALQFKAAWRMFDGWMNHLWYFKLRYKSICVSFSTELKVHIVCYTSIFIIIISISSGDMSSVLLKYFWKILY